MRQLVCSIAASLDGFIPGPKGEYDWILPRSGIDLRAIYAWVPPVPRIWGRGRGHAPRPGLSGWENVNPPHGHLTLNLIPPTLDP
jgi:hypothetical protein